MAQSVNRPALTRKTGRLMIPANAPKARPTFTSQPAKQVTQVVKLCADGLYRVWINGHIDVMAGLMLSLTNTSKFYAHEGA